MSSKVNEIKEKIKELNLGEISELVDGLKEQFNIQEQVAIQATTPAPGQEKAAEKSGKVSVKLIEIGPEKFKVWKEIVNIVKEQKDETISPIKAKQLTEKEDKIILEDVDRDKVEGEKGIKKRLEDLGAKVEIEIK